VDQLRQTAGVGTFEIKQMFGDVEAVLPVASAQKNLLEELAKVGRVTSRSLGGAPFESLLVLDAVLGLTSLAQARAFNQAIPMTGLVVTKLDSSTKRGAVILIAPEPGIPATLATVGESTDDLVARETAAVVRSRFVGANTMPCAVPGRCRATTMPATVTRVPVGSVARSRENCRARFPSALGTLEPWFTAWRRVTL